MPLLPGPGPKHRRHVIELALFCVFALLAIGFDLLATFWPFRYREVIPLLETTFGSKIEVQSYHRTYFPHPGYVARGLSFHRRGDMSIPPLATVETMAVEGTWTGLVFHPRTLYRIHLQGLHVRIPPPGSVAHGTDFSGSVIKTSQQRLTVQTIVADGTTVDFLGGQRIPPLHFQIDTLQVHNAGAHRALYFFTVAHIPVPPGVVEANGSVGPFNSKSYSHTPLSGSFSLRQADLSRLSSVSGHLSAQGRYSGRLSAMDVQGNTAIPDFRLKSDHTVRLDTQFHVLVNASNGDTEIKNVQARIGQSVISASGAVAGKPRKIAVTIETKNSRVEELLDVIEQDQPRVVGLVAFHAALNATSSPQLFLRRLNLAGELSLSQLRFVDPATQRSMNAFSERARNHPPGDPGADPPPVTAQASANTTFRGGIASFPDIRLTLPGAEAHLHGTFNLLDTRIDLTGKLAMQSNISHAATGWKSILLKPLIPFFHHRKAGAVVSVAVTGDADHPKLGQDILHDK